MLVVVLGWGAGVVGVVAVPAAVLMVPLRLPALLLVLLAVL